MNKKVTGILAYFSLVLWIVAYCAGDKEGAKFHLNQALVLTIANIIITIISRITVVGAIIGAILAIVWLVFWIMGLISAIKEEEKPLPLIGGIQILK